MAEHHIYTDLDSLLDTRLPLLAQFDMEGVPRYLRDKYHFRMSDWFWEDLKVTEEQWRHAWATRGGDLWKKALPTGAFDLLNDMYRSLKWEHDPSDPKRQVVITVNIAPYTIDADGQDFLRDVIAYHVPGPNVRVEVMNTPYWALDPGFVASRFKSMLIYDYTEWLLRFKDNPELIGLTSVLVISPRLARGNPIDPEFEPLIRACDPFQITEAGFAGAVALQLHEVQYFSIRE